MQGHTDSREALDQRARVFEAAVSRANDVIMILESEWVEALNGRRIAYVNEAFERVTEYSAEEAIGRSASILFGENTDRESLRTIRANMALGVPSRADVRCYCKSGREFWAESTISPVTRDDNSISHWMVIYRDITEQRRMAAEMQANDERIKLISRAGSDVIWDWDIVADSIWWSDNIESLMGYDPATIDNRFAAHAGRIDEQDRDRVVAEVEQLIAGPDTNWNAEYRFLRADGSIATVIDRGFVIRDADGAAMRLLGSLMDVTERRAIEEQLRQAQKLEAIGQLTGGIAHDFNNLLTIILGNAEVLSEQLTDPGLQDLAELTASAAERGAELTNRLLAFARRQALSPTMVDTGRLVEGMEPLLGRALDGAIQVKLGGGSRWLARVDADQLELAILNLALNSRDAMPDGGTLSIETADVVVEPGTRTDDIVPGDYVAIAVSDTGCGMSPETAQRAFEPFFTTREMGRSSGLGLSMVYGFVKQSGGGACIETELGAGTTVTLYLPRAVEQAPAAVVDGYRDSRGGGEHILVVEDDPLVRNHVSSLLRGLGYSVSSAGGAAEGLELLETDAHFDMLFTDIIMPGGLNGSELATRARAVRPGLKVLFTSGYTEAALTTDWAASGVELLRKPYRRAELADKIQHTLNAA